ncbi:hypothetical protein CI109_102636 [Kwoniella shandongensis]|uniref:Uncharacterized protein n=1 Tax=Kwoniella shandongensis TaxID=1734106 RepID=A0A5M6BUB3_9TREE|nr:uncharacterized protein CI109_005217 [Kwoniella shandongensis]KAA5526448.1 hypothetical protein CI109_005217 [Kwoniella shandongensis]
MSSSSLSLLPPSSDPLDALRPSSGAPTPVPASKPAIRRTYGRARPASPPPAETSDAPTSSASGYQPKSSPSKALLDRFSDASSAWRNSLSFLDTTKTQEEDNDDEVGEEEAKRAMERMRREARGEVFKDQSTPRASISTQAKRKESLNSLAIPKSGLGVSFSSSSLTTLPTSPPPSSPPITSTHASSPVQAASHSRALQAQSSESMEETLFPVRRSGLSGKPRRIVVTSDDEDEATEKRPQRTAGSPTPTPTSRTERGSSPALALERGQTPDTIPSDDEQDLGAYLAKRDAEEELSSKEAPKSSALEGLQDLFEDDEPAGPAPQAEKKGRPSKGLNKKELAEMQKDIARAQRERPVAIAKPEPERLPISSWLQMAGMALKEKPIIAHNPGLTFAHDSPTTSPAQVTPPDEIVAFTPSSAPRLAGATSKASVVEGIANSSSPTPGARILSKRSQHPPVIPGTSDGMEEDDGEDEQGLAKYLEKQKVKDLVEDARREKQKRLTEYKMLKIKQQQQGAQLNIKPSHPESDDDDFDIVRESPIKPRTNTLASPTTVNGRKFPDAKAVLSANTTKPAISRNRQQFLQRAGKPSRPKSEDLSETYLDFAGKAFGHADLKNTNSGAKPAGQKNGRDTALRPDEMAKAIRLKHQQQVAALQKKKEEDWGRVRKLPSKVEQDVEALVEATKKTPAPESEVDEDEDDEEFVPDEEEGEEPLMWSGEESEAEEADDVASSHAEEGKENQDVDTAQHVDDDEEDDEAAPIIKRKARTTAKVAFDSDDEDATTKSAVNRTPLNEMIAPPQVIKATPPTVDGFGDFDLAGFGDNGGGSPGFSQLFDPTQIGSSSGQDAFAQLRAQEPVGLLPVNALLPQVNISETQAERDNNLIAAELENAAMERVQAVEEPKKQYLNEQGLFTQTRPALREDTQHSDDDGSQQVDPRRQLGGRSTLSLPEGLNSTPYGKTQTQTQSPFLDESQTPLTARRESEAALMPSPTQQDGESFTRLRRRVSDPDIAEPVPHSPTQPSRNQTAFDRMMAAASRPAQPKQKVKSRLVDEQAEESDEDNGWAPIGGPEDEDEDGEDDGFVDGLVDDEAIDEEEKRRQDELAAAKAREIEAADDARREAEARKITEGQHRLKKRGMDFYNSDEEDDEMKPRRWSKKQRRKRMLDREDGLDKLDGEANVFRMVYDEDLESDEEEEEDAIPLSPVFAHEELTLSPEPVAKRSFRETHEMLKKRAEMNRGKDLDDLDDELDAELDLPGQDRRRSTRADTVVDEDEDTDMEVEESQFSISRSSMRVSTSVVVEENSADLRVVRTKRSLASFAQYVADESQANRRVGGGAGGVSVIVPKASSSSLGGASRSMSGSTGFAGRPAPVPHPHRQSTGASSSSSGSILLSKGNKFA